MAALKHIILASLVLALVAITTVDAAHAGPLDDAKASGLIGEKSDGYVGAVTGDASVQGLIDEINAGRRAKYEEIAAKRGAPVDAVAAIAGKKLIERTPGGQYVMGSDGQWQQK
ncbi:MAG: YdbL family protein [Pseudomonadota bacterium]